MTTEAKPTDELRECKCGSTNLVTCAIPLLGVMFVIECSDCGELGPVGDSPLSARRLWNTREGETK